jgi:hypothetical protein
MSLTLTAQNPGRDEGNQWNSVKNSFLCKMMKNPF